MSDERKEKLEVLLAEALQPIMDKLVGIEQRLSLRNTSEEVFTARVDARKYKPIDKHRVIFETFDSLKSGCVMELINDHDPKPLYYELQAEKEGTFEWQYLEEGPIVWRVAISKR